MKTNHESVINHIRQAIRDCKEDNTLAAAKKYLAAALRQAESVGKKRTRSVQTKVYEEEAKKNNERWQEMLKKGINLESGGDGG